MFRRRRRTNQFCLVPFNCSNFKQKKITDEKSGRYENLSQCYAQIFVQCNFATLKCSKAL